MNSIEVPGPNENPHGMSSRDVHERFFQCKYNYLALECGKIAFKTEVGQFKVVSSGYPKFIEWISGLTTATLGG